MRSKTAKEARMPSKKLCENEYRVFGVPGAGKTTYLTQKVQTAVQRGYRGDLLVASFTKAAATELAGRDMNLGNHQIGTLHAHCYGALGSPTIAETRIKEFNEAYPDFALSPKTDANTEEQDTTLPSGESRVDELFAEYNLCRNRKIDRSFWRPSVLTFASRWEAWKQETDYYDFTDLIQFGKDDLIYPPNQAKVGIFDEVQDFTPLQMDLIRHWGRSMKYVMIAGDDDQAIFLFSGATPQTFLDPPIPEERITILGKSHRCPEKIQSYASEFLDNIKTRQEKPLEPRKEGGEVDRIQLNYKMKDGLTDLLSFEINHGGKNDLDNPRTVMLVTSCGYMLAPVCKKLREKGIPFHNPYKKTMGYWNPLSTSPTSTPNKILAFLNPQGPWMGGYQLWTASQLALWTDLIKSKGVLQHGAKQKLKQFLDEQKDYDADTLLDLYMELFESEGLEQAVQLNHNWLRDHTTAEKFKRMEFPMQVLNKQGKKKLEQSPQLIIGTIHSIKGGQADTVFLAPDLSMRGYQDYTKGQGTEAYEAIMRQFYVGATRAREKLYILRPANTRQSVKEALMV